MEKGSVAAILADEFPVMHDAVRRPARGLRQRTYRAIAKRLALPVDTVRGNAVAADSLIEALLTTPGLRRYEVLAMPQAVAKLAGRAREWVAWGLVPSDFQIRSIADLADWAGKLTVGAWISPSGNIVGSLRIRREFASRLYPITVVAHGFGLPQALYTIFLRAILLGALECDSIVCPTRVARQAMLNVVAHVTGSFNREFGTRLEYKGRVDVIPLCVNTERLQPREKPLLRKRFGLPKEAFVLLSVGRMAPRKGDWFPFLRMFAGLVKRNHGRNLLLVMCGTQEGNYAEHLREYARTLRIADNVRFELAVSDEAKERLIPAADVLVAVSDTIHESFGLAPVEAMACGIPQVVCDWDGFRETVAHGETGFLVPTYWSRCDRDLAVTGLLLGHDFDHSCLGQSIATDMRSFGNFLQELIDNTELRARMGERSRRRAMELYSYAAAAKRYNELWSDLGAIADKLTFSPLGGQFEKPDYYSFYGHYASVTLSEQSPVRAAMPIGEAIATIEGLSTGPSLSDPRIIDAALLRTLLGRAEAINARGSGPRAMPLGDLVHALPPGNGIHPDRIVRHVMWLVKYGFIQPVPLSGRTGDSTFH
jgi:glycosyltransferase involved in cell wall biosynthesis